MGCAFSLAAVAMIAVSVVLAAAVVVAAGGNDEPWRYLLICSCLTLHGKESSFITQTYYMYTH